MRIDKEVFGKYTYCFVYDFDYKKLEFCRSLKNTHGYTNFGFSNGKWRFNNLDFLSVIQKYFGEENVAVSDDVMIDLRKHLAAKNVKEVRKQNADIIRNKMTSDLVIKGLNGEPYPYQKVGVEFFANNDGKAILADEPGTGKTLQSLAYIAYSNQEKSIIVCPALVKYSWEKEIKKWTKKKVFVVNSKDGITDEDFINNDIIVINYDIVAKLFKKLSMMRFDCMVCDEFHFIKNRFSRRTKATMDLAKKSKSVLLLSGTPMLNRPVELFTGLHIMDPETWNDWYAYTARYCDGHKNNYGWDASGATNIEELKERISCYFLRRKKSQVLQQLPPKILIDTPVELDKENAEIYKHIDSSVRDKFDNNKDMCDGSVNTLSLLNQLRQIASSGKIYAAKEIIDSVISNGQKIVVFSAYNYPLEHLHEHYAKESVMITGKVNEDDRKIAVDRFQEDDNVKVFLGGIKSAGAGITLTAASNVLFIDYSWVPADHEQGMDRTHRPGQMAESINVYQLHARGTIDDYMRSVIDSKRALITSIMEGQESDFSNVNIVRDVMKQFTKKQ
jgi:SWI/SNF-related matrix-associated actin-dependent regulator of chromatin subfamily A-like protein 1